MGEKFLAEQAKRFQHRADRGKVRFLMPDLLAQKHEVFSHAFNCRSTSGSELPQQLLATINPSGGIYLISANQIIGEVHDGNAFWLTDAANLCGGVIPLRVVRQSDFTNDFSVVIDCEK